MLLIVGSPGMAGAAYLVQRRFSDSYHAGTANADGLRFDLTSSARGSWRRLAMDAALLCPTSNFGNSSLASFAG